jgi:hypothetical protein
VSDETKPAPCAICGGEGVAVKCGEAFSAACSQCGTSADGEHYAGPEHATSAWIRAQARIREERAWQLVVALTPAAFPDVKFAGLTTPEVARRWERVWAAARLGVKAARAIADEAVR